MCTRGWGPGGQVKLKRLALAEALGFSGQTVRQTTLRVLNLANNWLVRTHTHTHTHTHMHTCVPPPDTC